MSHPLFLSGSEIGLIKSDWAALLKSPEATVVTFKRKELSGGSSVDDVFDVEDGSVEDQSFTGRAIQQIVKPRDEDLTKWGILEVGDCIFYTDIDHDLSQGLSESLVIEGPNGTEWIPVPRKFKSFHNYLLTRLGSSQLAQVVPCNLKR